MRCPECTHEISAGIESCPSCKTPLLSSPYAPAYLLDSLSEASQPGATPVRPAVLPSGSGPASGAADRSASHSVTLDSATTSRFPAGTILAERYRIVSLLGRGGMGEIYRADDLVLGQEVALKFLPEAMEQDSARLKRLLEEVKVARQISHPNVCRVYDVGQAEGLHFISMEYLDGENLTNLLRRIGRPQKEKAGEIGRQVCHGLAAAHEQGILHRDLKPSNLMIDNQGTAHITDFGLAGWIDSFSDREIRHGTPAYMAPEQHAGQSVSQRSDIYALGLVLYRLFTGRSAFDASSPEELARQHRENPPVSPTHWVHDIDPAVERAILRCLEKDPRDRPSSALAVAAALPVEDASADNAAVKTLLARELAGSAHWTEVLGEEDARALRRRHDRLARDLAEAYEGREIESTGEPYLLFDRPINAVRYALAYHRALTGLADDGGVEPTARVAVHLGEILLPGDSHSQEVPEPEVDGKCQEILSRLVDLTEGRQTLVTRGAFDLARQSSAAEFEQVRWLAHGSYEIAGLAEPLEIFEVGVERIAPLHPPRESDSVRRRIVQDTISGWRPAPGLELPQRPHWDIERKLGEGGFGEVWLALHRKTHERRVFKFCYDPERLKGLEREITLFRLLKEELGERRDITRILDWNFEEAPYFIESEYTAGGDLKEWSKQRGGIGAVPLAVRLEIVAQVATALAAAHSVGVLHKDVKPANVLLTHDDEGGVRARLNDFGVGLITRRERLQEVGITVLGMTDTAGSTVSGSSQLGTRLYMAPELLEGKPPTLQADIYALGVMLYQVLVGDFSRALAPGWDREIDDELLVEDIAAAVDGSFERRLSSAAQLAERLRTLEQRRAERAARQRERDEAEQARAALAHSRVRRKVALGVIAVLTLFVSVSLFLLHRISVEAKNSQQVLEFMIDLFKGSDPLQFISGDVSVLELLEQAEKKIDEFNDRPLIQARLRYTIGVIYRNLRFYERAEPLLRKALDTRGEHHAGDHVEIAESLDAFADVLHELEDFDEAERLCREGLAMRRRLLGDDHVAVAASLATLGHILRHHDHEEAEQFLREALDIRRRLLPESPEVSRTAQDLATFLRNQGRQAEAEPFYREALDIRRELGGDEHHLVASSHNSLGLVLMAAGDLEEAEKLFRRAIAIYELHDDRFLAVARLNLGECLVEQRRCGEAVPLILQARGVLELHEKEDRRVEKADSLLARCPDQAGS